MCDRCADHDSEWGAEDLLDAADDRCAGCRGQGCPGFRSDTVEFRGVEVPVTDPDQASGEETFQSTFRAIFDEAFDLLVERQRKYGPENIREQGIYGVFTRMSADKIERLRRSLNGKVVEGRIELDEFVDAADETVEDALLDIANYALIMLALKRGVWGRPLQ